ncbi:MAG: 30S ribosomal protein S20, partial [Flavobacteriales bacterium]|nr:30S ribosomal protein S20 [Flavobacteriales bacterium]
EATAMLPKVSAMIDKLTKTNIIHKNKASNLKSKLTKHVNALA